MMTAYRRHGMEVAAKKQQRRFAAAANTTTITKSTTSLVRYFLFIFAALTFFLMIMSAVLTKGQREADVLMVRKLRREQYHISSSYSNATSGANKDQDDYQVCIVVAFLSRSTEFELREWHRNDFQRQLDHFSEDMKKQVLILQRFMIGVNPEHSIMAGVVFEKQLFGDVMVLRVNEGYSYLTANTWDTFHQLIPVLETNPACNSAYLVRADTDFVFNYQTLAHAISTMPKTSTYFGTFIPNFPITEPIIRQAGSFAQTFLPLWTIGGCYGLSLDVLKHLTSWNVERTVLKKEEKYIFPEEDRAIGLALARSNFTVENMLFAKGVFHFCQPENFTCKDYGHFIGFSVGFGKSGVGKHHFDAKVMHLERIREIMKQECDNNNWNSSFSIFYSASDYYFKLDGEFKKEEPLKFMTYGCKSLSEEAQETVDYYNKSYSLALQNEETVIADTHCAEKIYLEVFPEVIEFIKNGTFSSGKEHYLEMGYRNTSMHYYCPTGCNHDPECSTTILMSNNIKCKDLESRYFKLYPDVEEAVKNGVFGSAYEHFYRYGKTEGKSYECPVYDPFKAFATGNKVGCYNAFETFINRTEHIVMKWPVTGHKIHSSKSTNSSNIDTCNAVLFVEGRAHGWMDYVLRVHRHYTGPDWMFYLVGPSNITKQWRKQYDGPMIQIIDLPERFGDLSDYPKQINDLYMSEFIWDEVIQCERVLISQVDALLLRHGIEDFFEYSYVGAPVYPESHPTIDWRLVSNKGDHHYGGNGGLSFRRKSFMLKQLKECKLKLENDGGDFISEDSWFSACLWESGAPLPTLAMANRFSTGSRCEVDIPIGVHKLWQNCEESICVGAIATSALYNEIFPSSITKTSDVFCDTGDMSYLARYPEVRMAVENGDFVNGFEHWVKHGHESETFDYWGHFTCRSLGRQHLRAHSRTNWPFYK